MEQKIPSTLAAAAFLAMALAGLTVPAWAQTNIDTFATNQALLSAPPDSSSTATGGADIIGTRRGVVVHNLTGAGPTTVVVTSGALTLNVTNTTPDSRGEATVTWDGDTNPTVLSATGLGGVDLTAGGARTFRIQVAASTVANQEIELIVYGNATDFSRASLLIPVVGAPQNFYLPFSEFVTAGGAGADFSSVGAVQMVVRSKEGALSLNEVVTSAPAIAATKTDALLIDTDGDTKADPGDRLRYTVTITNTGGEGVSVDLTDSVDANTTLVAGSVSSTPVAKNDQYIWFGNVNLSVDGTPAPTLLANDTDPDGDTVTISAFDATTAQGGTITGVNVNTGEFTYNPPAGFHGVDSFNYTIVDNDAHTSVATARITLEGVVWFVDDSNTTPPHLGTLSDPFQTLASVNGTDPDEPGDIIFLYDDDGTPYPGGMTLEANQVFLGQGVGLVLGGQTIVPAGGTPQITNAAGVGLTLAADNTVRGLDVQGTSGASIAGTSFGTLTANNMNVTSAGGAALDLATGNLAATFGTLSSTGTGGQRGIQLVTVTGSMTATTTSLTNPTTQGIRVATSPGVTLDFGNTTITDNAVGSGATAIGIDVATGNAGASFTFDSLAVTTDAGGGLLANGSGTINIGGTTNTINATGGAAVDITSTILGGGATFSTLSSSNSTGKGVNLDTVTGSFTANGGSISGPAGVAFDLNAGASNVTYTGSVSNTANSRLIEVTSRTGGNVTFSGTLSGTSSSNGILVQNNNTGAAQIIAFSGATQTLNTGTDPAVTLDNNDVATIDFTGGGLDIDTTSGAGFNAINGAVAISVQGSNNSIATSTGTGLTVNNTTIGGSGLSFRSISTNGAPNGIVLIGTGALGGLTVNGDGTNTAQGGNSTGGTIANATGADLATSGSGIYMDNTSNVVLRRMTINGTNQNFGIRGFRVNNLTMEYMTVNGTNGTCAACDNYGEGAVMFGDDASVTTNGLIGSATVKKCILAGGYQRNLSVVNTAGSLNRLTITGTSFGAIQDTAAGGNQALAVEARNAGTIVNVTVDGSTADGQNTFTSGPGGLVNFTGQTATTMDVVFNDNALSNNHPDNIIGSTNTWATQGVMTFNIFDNTIRDSHGSAVTFQKASAGTSLSGTFNNNMIGVTGVAGSGSASGNGIFFSFAGGGVIDLNITNNQIRRYNGNGAIFADNTGGNYDVRLNVTGNLATEAGPTSAGGFLMASGAPSSADDIDVCVQLGGAGALANNFSAGEPTGLGADILLGVSTAASSMRIVGYNDATPTAAEIQTYVLSQNPTAGTIVQAYVDAPATFSTANWPQQPGACAAPPY